MATAADGDGDASAFGLGYGNDAAIVGDVRYGRTAPFSARAPAAVTETTKVLKIKSGVRHPVEAKEALQVFPRIMMEEILHEEREKFGSIVFWEVGYVSLFRYSRMSYTDI